MRSFAFLLAAAWLSPPAWGVVEAQALIESVHPPTIRPAVDAMLGVALIAPDLSVMRLCGLAAVPPLAVRPSGAALEAPMAQLALGVMRDLQRPSPQIEAEVASQAFGADGVAALNEMGRAWADLRYQRRDAAVRSLDRQVVRLYDLSKPKSVARIERSLRQLFDNAAPVAAQRVTTDDAVVQAGPISRPQGLSLAPLILPMKMEVRKALHKNLARTSSLALEMGYRNVLEILDRAREGQSRPEDTAALVKTFEAMKAVADRERYPEQVKWFEQALAQARNVLRDPRATVEVSALDARLSHDAQEISSILAVAAREALPRLLLKRPYSWQEAAVNWSRALALLGAAAGGRSQAGDGAELETILARLVGLQSRPETVVAAISRASRVLGEPVKLSPNAAAGGPRSYSSAPPKPVEPPASTGDAARHASGLRPRALPVDTAAELGTIYRSDALQIAGLLAVARAYAGESAASRPEWARATELLEQAQGRRSRDGDNQRLETTLEDLLKAYAGDVEIASRLQHALNILRGTSARS